MSVILPFFSIPFHFNPLPAVPSHPPLKEIILSQLGRILVSSFRHQSCEHVTNMAFYYFFSFLVVVTRFVCEFLVFWNKSDLKNELEFISSFSVPFFYILWWLSWMMLPFQWSK